MGNPEIRPGHLLASMVVQEDGVVARICDFVGVPVDSVKRQTAAHVDTYSKVAGGTKAMWSRELQAALDLGETEAKSRGDTHVSSEVLLIGLSAGSGKTGQLLRGLGMTRDKLLPAIEHIRGGQKVTG